MNPEIPDNIDTLLVNCRMARMDRSALTCPADQALAVTGSKISWIGDQSVLTKEDMKTAGQVIDGENRCLMPGFVDCHTHLVWAGSRAEEFEARLKGESYESIAKKGGGIVSTVRATRNASMEELFHSSARKIDHFIRQGITTVEIKTGYGLDLETELKILEAIQRLKDHFPIHIEPSFLGAHATPPEFKDNPGGYVKLVKEVMLPAVRKQGIATAVDAFCENIAFSPEQTRKILEAAKKLDFKIKLHAEQLSDSSGSCIASELGALSCDHLEYLSEPCARKMAEHGVTAVLLPGAFYYLKETKKPPIDLLRRLGISMAVSTDLNPGTSPVYSMLQVLNMSCVLFGLTCKEALIGATLNGAKALGIEASKGSLEIGKDADLVLWDLSSPIDLCYQTGFNEPDLVMIRGEIYLNRIIDAGS